MAFNPNSKTHKILIPSSFDGTISNRTNVSDDFGTAALKSKPRMLQTSGVL